MKGSVDGIHFHNKQRQFTIETRVCDIAHRMLNGPDNTIHKELELVRGKG
jgi:hypothetical protein